MFPILTRLYFRHNYWHFVQVLAVSLLPADTGNLCPDSGNCAAAEVMLFLYAGYSSIHTQFV